MGGGCGVVREGFEGIVYVVDSSLEICTFENREVAFEVQTSTKRPFAGSNPQTPQKKEELPNIERAERGKCDPKLKR